MSKVKVLLTGASSFSGLWIARALAGAGHHVIAPLKRPLIAYSSLRRERVQLLAAEVDVRFDAPLESDAFKAILSGEASQAFIHHAADIPNYGDPSYDLVEGFNRNVSGLADLIAEFSRAGGQSFLASGSIFEFERPAAEQDKLAISPYGLSKSLTNITLQHYALWSGLSFGRLVISAPFGPYEEGRFAWSLVKAWSKGMAGTVRTPRYVRDNIPASLLGQAYAAFLDQAQAARGVSLVARPMGFAGTQLTFAERLAQELGPRLGLECEIEALAQPHLDQPETVLNTDPAIPNDWRSAEFWDDYADFYARIIRTGAFDEPT